MTIVTAPYFNFTPRIILKHISLWAERLTGKFKWILLPLFVLSSFNINALDLDVLPGESIQDAIDSVSLSGGGVVTLVAGTHYIFKPLRMKSNLTLQGEGDWASLIKTNVNMKMIIADAPGLVNITIQNLEIQGTNAENGGGIEIVANPENEHDNVKVINVHCFNTGWGVHLKGAKNILIDECLFENNGNSASERFAHNLYLRRVFGALVMNSRFINSPSANGINISYSENVEVIGCEISGNHFRGVRAAVTEGFKVHNCIVENNGDVGIIANSEIQIGVQNVDIQNNCVSGNAKGIATPGADNGIVANNNSYDNSSNYELNGVSNSDNISDASLSCFYESPSVVLNAREEKEAIQLHWVVNSAESTDQRIFRNTDPDPAGWTEIATSVQGDIYTDNTAVPGTIYWYWIQVTDTSTSVITSNAKNATSGSRITLVSESGNESVQLNWALDGIELGSQNIYRDTDSIPDGRTLIAENVTGRSFIDKELANDQSYWYWVQTTDVTSLVTDSRAVLATPSTAEIFVTAISDLESVTIEWKFENLIPERVDLFRDTDDNPSGRQYITGELVGNTYTDNSVTAGTNYWYWIKVTDINSNVFNSDPVLATPTAAPILSLSAQANDGSVDLTWTLENITLNQLDIYRNTDSEPEGRSLIESDVSGNTFTDNSVDNGTTYWYWIKATDSNSQILYSSPVNATPLGPAEIMLSAVENDGIIELSWSIENIILERLDIFRDTDSTMAGRFLIAADVKGDSFTDEDVTSGTTYWYWLKTTDVNSIELNSEAVKVSSGAKVILSTNENSRSNLNLFPNPVSEILRLNFDVEKFNQYSIQAIDGKFVLDGQIDEKQNSIELNISHLPAGVYFITLKGVVRKQGLKFLKK